MSEADGLIAKVIRITGEKAVLEARLRERGLEIRRLCTLLGKRSRQLSELRRQYKALAIDAQRSTFLSQKGLAENVAYYEARIIELRGLVEHLEAKNRALEAERCEDSKNSRANQGREDSQRVHAEGVSGTPGSIKGSRGLLGNGGEATSSWDDSALEHNTLTPRGGTA